MIACSTMEQQVNEEVMTHDDSIKMYVKQYSKSEQHVSDSLSIHDILDDILKQKQKMLLDLDKIQTKTKEVELRAEYYAKAKEDEKTKQALLAEISTIKAELNKINDANKSLLIAAQTVKEEDLGKNNVTSNVNSSFENLPPGNYITRLDRKHLISIRVTVEGMVYVSEPRLDSTTVLTSSKKIPLKMQKQLSDIRNNALKDIKNKN